MEASLSARPLALRGAEQRTRGRQSRPQRPWLALYSAKGGAGVTTCAALCAVQLCAAQPVLLVDLAGDLAVLLGVKTGERPGVYQWLESDPADPEALARLEVPITPTLSLLPSGPTRSGPHQQAATGALVSALAAERRAVVVDCSVVGPGGSALGALVVHAARTRWLVTRACYLALRRVQQPLETPHGVILVSEPRRVLRAADVAEAAGAPVVVDLALDAQIARLVDSGSLIGRAPRGLLRSFGAALEQAK